MSNNLYVIDELITMAATFLKTILFYETKALQLRTSITGSG